RQTPHFQKAIRSRSCAGNRNAACLVAIRTRESALTPALSPRRGRIGSKVHGDDARPILRCSLSALRTCCIALLPACESKPERQEPLIPNFRLIPQRLAKIAAVHRD